MKQYKWIAGCGAAVAGMLGIAAYVSSRKEKKERLDDDNEYILAKYEAVKGRNKNQDVRKDSLYTIYVKRVLDITLSTAGLIILSPVYALISIAIYIDDPGPVMFRQKRVGKNCSFFYCHKFRSMKMSAPHDVPTHQLTDPKQYITKVGKVLRRTSLDELPQIWDILRGKMSVIGPRPALWNQDDLIAERDKYGANDVIPGLTGLAQISGRDELEISEKARFDGEYVDKQGFLMDLRCFLGTIASVLKHDGVVEGGTGSISRSRGIEPVDPTDVGFEEYGYKKKFEIDKTVHKKVLITGAGSYIGESFKAYCMSYYPNIECTTIDMVDESWKSHTFTDSEGKPYDTVFHVAGIAHADVGKVSEADQRKYYDVNSVLAIECCKKSKDAGIRQFIFLSSMIIYGCVEYIDKHTIPQPDNFYGDSKWQGDIGVRKLASENFKVAVARLPMIYGSGSKGNYQVLSKLARRISLFPEYNNTRSMLYIENLCEFASLLVLSGEGGIYFPQNSNYVKTAEMVKTIAAMHGSKYVAVPILNSAVSIAKKVPGKIGDLAKKAFGNRYYNQELSRYEELNYQVVEFEESIKRTERENESEKKLSKSHKHRVLILVNHEVVIYNFRLELVERLLKENYEVHISAPTGERVKKLRDMGAVIHTICFDRHGMDPVDELSILRYYRKLVREIKPIIVLGYTIKPNIYGAMASRMCGVPFVANITGLGTAVENGGVKQKLTILMYKAAFGTENGRIQRVFFQNRENEEFFRKKHIALNKHGLLPGSGVNTERFPYSPLPACGDGKTGEPVKFAFISRIMVEKGIEQYLDAAESVKEEYPNTEFHVCGFFEPEYDRSRLDELCKNGTVIYDGNIEDVAGFMSQMHCVVHPTYYPEGLSNVLLEASSCGRPIITTDRAGCREVVEDNGFLVPEKDEQALIDAIKRFIEMNQKLKGDMGKSARMLMEEKFDRNFVVDAYMEELHGAERRKNNHTRYEVTA